MHVYIYFHPIYEIMAKHRAEDGKYRNIRLTIDTYHELNNYLLRLMQSQGNTQLSFNEAVRSLLKQHNRANQ